MRYRTGVVIAFPDGPKMSLAKTLADETYREVLGWPEALCTSQHDGTHSTHSWHYARLDDDRRYPLNPVGSEGAIDLRTWRHISVPSPQLPRATKDELAALWLAKLEAVMPGEWYVLVESDHIHGHHLPPDQRRTEATA